MTRDEAAKLIEKAVEQNKAGRFNTVEEAAVIAGMALNYIMDQVDNEVKEDGEEGS